MHERNQDDLSTTDAELLDGRDDLPLQLHWELDDLPLSAGAFRVYVHLVRRAGRDNRAWPSYKSIGRHCFRRDFPRATDDTLKRRAIEAVKELEAVGLVRIEKRQREDGTSASNVYRLTSRREWRPEDARAYGRLAILPGRGGGNQ